MGKAQMNKLLVDKEMFLKDYVGTIILKNEETTLNIMGDCKINEIILDKHNKLIINALNDSKLEYNRFCLFPHDNGLLEINHEKNTEVFFNEAIICNSDYQMDLNIYENNSDVFNKTVVRILTQNEANVLINAKGHVFKDTLNNSITEDVRAFNLDDSKVTIIPNLIVDSNDVIANHNVTVSNINNDNLFYLNSKGIDNKKAVELLKNAFLLSIFNDSEYKELVKENL